MDDDKYLSCKKFDVTVKIDGEMVITSNNGEYQKLVNEQPYDM